jgi:hypothetical protein
MPRPSSAPHGTCSTNAEVGHGAYRGVQGSDLHCELGTPQERAQLTAAGLSIGNRVPYGASTVQELGSAYPQVAFVTPFGLIATVVAMEPSSSSTA